MAHPKDEYAYLVSQNHSRDATYHMIDSQRRYDGLVERGLEGTASFLLSLQHTPQKTFPSFPVN
jgi:hypothetical protein